MVVSGAPSKKMEDGKMEGQQGKLVIGEVKGRWLQQQKADAGRFVLRRITVSPGYHLYTPWAALYTDRSIRGGGRGGGCER